MAPTAVSGGRHFTYFEPVDGAGVSVAGLLAGGRMNALPEREVELPPVALDEVDVLEPCGAPAASAEPEIARVRAKQAIRYFSKISSKTSSL
jgi:hypothetical protein